MRVTAAKCAELVLVIHKMDKFPRIHAPAVINVFIGGGRGGVDEISINNN